MLGRLHDLFIQCNRRGVGSGEWGVGSGEWGVDGGMGRIGCIHLCVSVCIRVPPFAFPLFPFALTKKHSLSPSSNDSNL